ncbi:uncharacterized protein LOC123475376 [Daphnia magna]|nr:uncharacterized protein LOC123475376 [Daphnia magna]
MAKGRLESLLKRLKRTPELLSAYHKEIDQLRVQNFVEEADQNYEGLHTYLPHHPVIRQDKKSPKIRPVFDGAAKSKYGPSINDVLETGPNLNPDLLAVLMRFRLNKIAWIADIEKAFLNIALHPEDAEAVRFLWITEPETPNWPLVAYKWKRVPFGLSSSTFLLRATLNKHLDGMESIYSTTVRQLKEQIYVDDYLGGADNISTAKTRIQETKSIFQEAKLNIEKGLINPIVKIFTQKLEEGQPKVLGIRWDTESDTFQFDPAPIIEAATELGELKLWEAEIDWDVEAPPEIRKTWIAAMTGLNEFANLKIPRWIGYSKRVIQNAEIHVFGDASKTAYGAVAYARLQSKNGDTIIQFLASKTKVVPLPKKKVTLPRLELLSSLLAARLGEKLKNFLHIESWRTIFWADSLVALGWIRGDTNRWKPFVRNQVQTIKKLSGPNWWRHCPGVENPADLASRGAPAVTLVHSKLWWNGPSWLKEDETKCPDSTPEVEEPSVHERIEAEAKSKTVTMSVASVEPATSVEWHLDLIPSWNRLLRRTAWILRFASKNRPTNATQVKTPIKTGDGKQIMEEHLKTKSVWHACVKCQRLSSPPFREIAAPLPINRLKQAKAFEITGVDFAGSLYYKHPTLRKKRKQTDPTSSTDPSSTDGSALEPTVEPPAMEPIEEPPTTEPTEENKENLQLDEFSAKKKGIIKQPKSYACLFICAVTRAVHLELTKTMSARDFLLAFRRFSARRGSVSIMYSDNAQTFRCVSKHLKVLRSDPAIHDLLAMRKTEWIFSASLAPWWGGFWERMVRTMKDLFRRSNGRACLEYDEIEVSLIETESVVNARPLTYVAEGSDDPLPITPHQEYVSDICERFVTDYFLQIDKFHCKGGPGRKIQVGEVVIIHDDNTKRLMWTIGVVKEIITSRDGLIRSVMVKTLNGNLINRAIQSLHPLELREDQPDDVEIPPTPELELEPEEATPPVAAADPVEQEEPWTTGSGGHHFTIYFV